ncbi:GGDEF domain-containing protein [Sphingomonas sp. HDW15A]|uniref:GGDEF domain-containing protein n=1 Tax=Sphingomonas sp. HDW15A TaxID=2714942 RepID=UPI00140E6888|nr:GGDEF domain-containing protein [Sphingomonas sp. HDW15A]QIK95888.1 GGDEF domain-containing protein [Sphingomonas sp. HDW15A]
MPLQVQLPSTNGRASERLFVSYLAVIAMIVTAMIFHKVLDHAGFFSESFEKLSYPLELTLDLSLLGVICAAFPHILRELRRRTTSATEAHQARVHIELLFKMTDMLQSALGHADANSVLRSTATSLMPGFGGALYIFNNSGDRLELSTSWDWPERAMPRETISPQDCWAIKRGKPHLNLIEQNALCCDHQQSELVTMEIPMMARGEIYGLLLIQRDGGEAAAELQETAVLATALADAMSLSLSNLALRERLRTQALRDALTGLYNRRYMEDALERYSDQASRTRSPLSIVMIDLDHFKKLNDEHGHAMGDVILAEAATAILGTIRPCDIACRYGGEELVVLLPDCSLEEATAKAELLRNRIERLSDRHGIPVSASLGVSTISETSKAKDGMADADRALYRAKQEGRNRVVPAERSIREVASSKAA